MKAVQLNKFGGTEEMYIGDVPEPIKKPGEVLVRVHATALNRADLLQRQGKYPPPKGESEILGLEMAGEVVECDKNSMWQPGNNVMALLAGGGYAEFVSVPDQLLMPIPEGYDYNQAAAIPEVFLTAYQALFFEGRSEPGQTALIHAGASGVGTAAIQLARVEGIEPIVTCSKGKHQNCLELGASLAIDYQLEDFVEKTIEATSGNGADIILDFIGQPNFHSNIKALAQQGKLILLATMGGYKVDEVNLAIMMRKHLTIIGTTLRSRSLEYRAELTKAFSEKYLTQFETGKIKPVIDSIYSLKDIAEAHRHMVSNRNIGKIVVEI